MGLNDRGCYNPYSYLNYAGQLRGRKYANSYADEYLEYSYTKFTNDARPRTNSHQSNPGISEFSQNSLNNSFYKQQMAPTGYVLQQSPMQPPMNPSLNGGVDIVSFMQQMQQMQQMMNHFNMYQMMQLQQQGAPTPVISPPNSSPKPHSLQGNHPMN